MKRMIVIVTALTLCVLMLSACGAKKTEEPAAQIANPVKTYENIDGQLADTKLALAAPEGAENVVYKSINGMPETDFTLDSVEYFFRAQPTGETSAYDISGLYFTWTEQKTDAAVAGRAASVFTCADAGYVMWLDVVPGINYNLGSASGVSADTLLAVAEKTFAPVQGEVSGN